MKIKTKLTLGVGLLFIMILLLSIVGVYKINIMKSDTENILTANYHSLEYCRNMLSALENKSDSTTTTLDENLKLQEENATEIGEEAATIELRKNFEQYKSNLDSQFVASSIRNNILNIMNVNMEAIQRKSDLAKKTAETATIVISIVGTVCFMLAFTLLLNLPSNIADPIKELTQSIKEIADENYAQRVHFEQNNEFGELAHSFNVMAEKLEEYNNSNLAKLMQEKQRIETLINNMHNPVIGLDENRKVIFVNNEALKVSGLKREEVEGKQVQDIAIHNDLIRSLIQDLLKPNDNRDKPQQPLKIFADNKESYFEKEIIPISITPTAEKQSKHIGDVILLQNITPFKELDFAKTNFIATVSHELKTPISSILMSLNLLENEKIGIVNLEQKQLIQSVKEDSERLLKITGELLNMTQVEVGKIQLSLQAASPLEIIQYATNVVKTQADQKGVTIQVECPANLPSVNADSEKTAWVLTNLMINAINYSFENSKVVVSAHEEEDKIIFTIQDFGKGIDSKYLPKLFDRYFQIPGSSKSGTGLGLAISKEFVEAQGGHIFVQSDIGKGSIFSLALNKAAV
ncbi:MAG: HAMP domain-containing protein [Bacteroidia bacterium]|nr:HAMP domain-containing protein [Bacteroidia bacterium]MCZ2249517.1 HAMP domain-containing protein [Bacteroidia bacterium]